MTENNGAIIHVERGYRIVEVLDGQAFVGYRLLGPGAERLPVFESLSEALGSLAWLAENHPRSDGGAD